MTTLESTRTGPVAVDPVALTRSLVDIDSTTGREGEVGGWLARFLSERGDYAAARKLHHWLLPLLQVNFAESNPIPCKAAMAAMGLIEESYRLPMVPPSPAAREKVMRVLQQLKLLGAAARV